MNTKKLDNESTPKGGKDNTRVVLTAAGAVVVGAGAGVGASTLLNDDEKPEAEAQEQQNQEQQNQEQSNHETENTQQQTAQPAQQTTQQPHPQPTNATEPIPIATDTPTTGGGQTSTPATGGGQTTSSTTSGGNSTEDVNAEALAVAEQILSTDDVDPNDIDATVNIAFNETGTVYGENGEEIPVAAVTTPDGGEYMLADIDGDRVYDAVYDMEGNPVSGVQAGLNTSDAQLALGDNNEYIPISENDPELQDNGSDDDIMALNDGNHGSQGIMEEVEEDVDDLFETTSGNDNLADNGTTAATELGIEDSELGEDISEA